ncbi:MAG: DUF2793 domain-containing protein [Neomegalonema sp.]|nr:DUF2793 domain-containing protein [Neomegalonema sp.]
MSDTTPRLGLSLLVEGQSQKHITVNEALLSLEWYGLPTVKDRDLTAPPDDPVDGDAYLIAVGASGDWQGHGAEIALRVGGGWVYHAPVPGMLLYVEDENIHLKRGPSAWQVASL